MATRRPGSALTLQSNDIAQWRVRVFSLLLPFVLVLGAISALPSILLATSNGHWVIAIIRLLSLAWMFLIWRLERAPYVLRVLNFLICVSLLGIALLVKAGPSALLTMMAVPVMAVILLGLRPAIIALALSALCVLVLTSSSIVQLHLPGLGRGALHAALFTTLNFTSIGALVTLSCGALLRDMTRSLREARRGAAKLELLNQDLRLTSRAIAHLNDLVLIARTVDTPGACLPISFANDAFLRHSGYARDEVIGRSMRMFEGPATDPVTTARMVDAVGRRQQVSAELVNYKRNGEAYWLEVEMVPFAGDSGSITHWVIVGRDITERRQAADAIHRLAYFDGLTGLPNRRLLFERMAALVADARRGRALGALLYVDLDHFKTINDARGHASGDLVLTHAADRLGLMMGPHDTVARLGGDEFVVLLCDLGADPDRLAGLALARAEQIRLALARRMDIDGQRHYATASIGVALAMGACRSEHDLLREGDIAMYRAKARGRNGVALFEPGMLEDAERRLEVERDLAQALENGEMAVNLQLQVDRAGRPCGAEVLVRWRRADGRMVPPDDFIPVAESSGQIVQLGEWALRQSCLAWHRLASAGHTLPLSVNVSPVQFRQPDFVARIEAILFETSMPPGQLILEITEGLLVDRMDQTIAHMQALAELGVRISIDDFGTGYSSLIYLTRMPLYELKIDKSFIRATPHDASATAIVRSVLSMAGHLGLRVVAEGVENEAQAAWLAARGNAIMQGYLFHRPMPLDGVIAHLDAALRKRSGLASAALSLAPG